VNRLISVSYSDGKSASFSYDALGNRVKMMDWNGSSSYTYDALKRLTSVTAPDGSIVRYGYDAAGRRTSLTYPDGHGVQIGYDGAGNLTAVTDWASHTTTYTYDPAGNLLTTLLANGVTSTYIYDAANRLTGVTGAGPGGPLPALAYTMDNVGNRIKLAIDGKVTSFSYDALDRMIRWTSPSGATTEYSYDAVGNRTSEISSSGVMARSRERAVVSSYDDAEELLTMGSTSFTYDGNGSRLTKTSGGRPGVVSYSWDGANRLASISGIGISVLYTYDGDGNRLTQSSAGNTLTYINDLGPTVIHQNSPDGSIDYIQGRSLIAGICSNATTYVTYDGAANVSSVTDDLGSLKVLYAYDPWGTLLNLWDRVGSREPYKFAGQSFDSGSGIYYMRARYYDPATGQFLSRDPLGANSLDSRDTGPYIYARNNSLRYFDPTGLSAQKTADKDATSPTLTDTQLSIANSTADAIRSTAEYSGKAIADVQNSGWPTSSSLWNGTYKPLLNIFTTDVGPLDAAAAAGRVGGVGLGVLIGAADPDVGLGFASLVNQLSNVNQGQQLKRISPVCTGGTAGYGPTRCVDR
jgi:RHS repeat-associated protein